MKSENSKTLWEVIRSWLPWTLIPLILGVLAAIAIPIPKIGVISFNDAIYDYSGQYLIAQIRYAREHPEIRAVVLKINSPGGTVVDTEAAYLELVRLRQEKPVVASVGGMAASGGYYLISGADYVYAKPTSMIGNVGVIGYLPPEPFLFEEIISTGPYKLWGSPRDTYQREIEAVKQGFYQAVIAGRGERLKIGPETLLRGQIWLGTEALELGLIDALGSDSDAIEEAAEMAKVWHYDVIDVIGLIIETFEPTKFYASADGVNLSYPEKPGLYMLYIPPLPTSK